MSRLAMWWRASCEISDLTRDREQEARVLDEMAVRLEPGPWAIAALFHRRAPGATDAAHPAIETTSPPNAEEARP
ncbi:MULTISPECIES: hypothetical protein [unclassified Frigoribacterium]|uniref:hypothetical protein n=1 Tax=unclassified Frigoribacterium TaxID=2627005 RepID=UPI0005B76658|nr:MULTISPECIES: hypothetical protein [unclassified Frigoribacterium]KIU03377.1 hypothetical protein SZ60_06315 [Frigoribacterium sp. MEB024]KQN41272.1 hypothetical protein ASE87_10230 [Frigoribacterium sp. Leaf44]